MAISIAGTEIVSHHTEWGVNYPASSLGNACTEVYDDEGEAREAVALSSLFSEGATLSVREAYVTAWADAPSH